MNYKLEIKDGKYNLYSTKIERYVMENASIDEVKIAIATEMEYRVKLDIVKLLMTFPHDFLTMDGRIIAYNEAAVEEYEAWYHKTNQRIGFLKEYYSLIEQKIMGILK